MQKMILIKILSSWRIMQSLEKLWIIYILLIISLFSVNNLQSCMYIYIYIYVHIYTVKTAQYWLIYVNYPNCKVKNNWEKYTNELINIKIKIKTTSTTQSLQGHTSGFNFFYCLLEFWKVFKWRDIWDKLPEFWC